MLNLILFFIGWVVGPAINALADDLPKRRRIRAPQCPNCQHHYSLLHMSALVRWLSGRKLCPSCSVPTRRRVYWTELATVVVFALLPYFTVNLVNLTVMAFYQAVLILIIVIDLEHRLILNIVTYPVTILALGLAALVNDNSSRLALIGALVGFAFFFVTYIIGRRLFGEGALGFGDVKLAMMMGAMLGLHRIIFALMFGILLGGGISAILLASRRYGRNTYLPYGQYLASAGMVMLAWGCQTLAWYADGEFDCGEIGSILYP